MFAIGVVKLVALGHFELRNPYLKSYFHYSCKCPAHSNGVVVHSSSKALPSKDYAFEVNIHVIFFINLLLNSF